MTIVIKSIGAGIAFLLLSNMMVMVGALAIAQPVGIVAALFVLIVVR